MDSRRSLDLVLILLPSKGMSATDDELRVPKSSNFFFYYYYYYYYYRLADKLQRHTYLAMFTFILSPKITILFYATSDIVQII